ncbi:hypothetical protein H0H87_008308 [Tephrocybe sp. NHM501043]|nr:hypothetical protein H0H87_008308 [Tephrocybe sp. NHM501043]
MFKRALFILGAIVAPQLSLAAVASMSRVVDQVQLDEATHSDWKCPKGFHHGFESISWHVGGMHASTFMNKTGSFLHGEWYDGPITETSGTDNTVGATRTSLDPDGPPIVERLTYYYRTPKEWVMRFVLDNKTPVVIEKMVFASYDEEIRAESICGGKATYLSMTATYCSEKVAEAYSLFDLYRRRVMLDLETNLGVLVFDGTCPKQGAKVTAHYNSSNKNLEPILSQYGEKVQSLQADLTVEDAVAKLFESASSHFGPVQIIIVNHAIWPISSEPVVQMSLDQWRSTIDINLTASFLVCREFLKGLQSASESAKDYASILFIGSSSGKFGEFGHADYSASKSAMMYGFTLTLKNEIVKIAPKGRVNCVAPGWVRTPMVAEALNDPEVAYRAIAT